MLIAIACGCTPQRFGSAAAVATDADQNGNDRVHAAGCGIGTDDLHIFSADT